MLICNWLIGGIQPEGEAELRPAAEHGDAAEGHDGEDDCAAAA